VKIIIILGAQLLLNNHVCQSMTVFLKKSNIAHAVFKFLHLRNNISAQIKAELDAVYGSSILSFTTVKRWTAELKCDRVSLNNDEHSEWPIIAITTDIIKKVHQIVYNP